MGDADVHVDVAQVSPGTVLQRSCGQSAAERRGRQLLPIRGWEQV